MVTINNTYSGKSFSYSAENCTATGESRVENEKIVSININGQYTKDGTAHNFWASRDNQGNVNVSGVPASVIGDVAEIEAEVEPSEAE